jgi:hypothetical protein
MNKLSLFGILLISSLVLFGCSKTIVNTNMTNNTTGTVIDENSADTTTPVIVENTTVPIESGNNTINITPEPSVYDEYSDTTLIVESLNDLEIVENT